MKCVMTGQDTNMLTHGIPLSREGRKVWEDKHKEYNEVLKSKFVSKYEDSGNNAFSSEYLANIAPKISKNNFLKMARNIGIDRIFELVNNVEDFK